MVEAYMKRVVFLLLAASFFIAETYAQDYNISGSVADINGEKDDGCRAAITQQGGR